MEANNHQFLQYSLKCLVSMGFVPNQRFNRRLLMQLTTYFLNVSLSVLFLLHDATTFWEYTNSIFICLSSGVCLLLFIIFIFQAEKIFEIIDFGQNFFEDRIKRSVSRMDHIEANIRVEKWSRIAFFLLAICVPIVAILPKPILSYFLYFTTDLGGDAFELTFPIWVPYDWRNPTGYLVTTIYQYISLQRFLGFFALGTALGIAGLLYGISVVGDMKTVLKLINSSAIAGEQNKSEAIKKLHEFIAIHAMVKERVLIYSNGFQPFEAVIFASSLATICCAMLMIQMELSINNDDSFAMLFIAIGYGLYSISLLFIVCEITQRGGDAVNDFDMEIGQIDWYLYPIEMQKMLPTIINVAQKPVEFKWFGSTASDRDTFKKICNKGYSFFMVLRGFSK